MAAVAVVEAAAGKDAIAEGLVDLLKPAIKQLDMHVHAVRYVLSPPESMCHRGEWMVRPSDCLLTSQMASSGVIVIFLLLEDGSAYKFYSVCDFHFISLCSVDLCLALTREWSFLF